MSAAPPSKVAPTACSHCDSSVLSPRCARHSVGRWALSLSKVTMVKATQSAGLGFTSTFTAARLRRSGVVSTMAGALVPSSNWLAPVGRVSTHCTV